MKPKQKLDRVKGLKQSSDQYRNIKGIHYTLFTSDPSIFCQVKKESKDKGLKTIVISNQLYIEVK